MISGIKFLVDECTGPAVANWLVKEGHEVYSVFDISPGMSDLAIVEKANEEDWVIITNDNDFSDLIYRDGKNHHGVFS